MSIPSEPSWSLVAAVNREDVLQSNLLRSAQANGAGQVILLRHAANAGQAYNSGLAEATGDVVVFAHQDVFLPPRWGSRLRVALELLAARDPRWGVAGVYGITPEGRAAGLVYSTGLQRFVGRALERPERVGSLDEMVLIVRNAADLAFDERLPGFHLYGTDICQEAERRGLRAYALPCFALHNSRGLRRLPWSYWQAYAYLRRKWRARLPIVTPCSTITAHWPPMLLQLARDQWAAMRRRVRPGVRVPDPERFYAEELAPQVEGGVRREHVGDGNGSSR